jgi:hypothetical protein
MEKLFLGFLKSILGVRKTVPTPFLYKELNVFPLINDRLVKILRFWLKILKLSDTHPVKKVYNILKRETEEAGQNTNWALLVKNMLFKNGLGFAWIQQYIHDENNFECIFRNRINDIFLQKCQENIDNVSDNRLFKSLDSECTYYLSEINDKHIRNAIAKIRLGSHNFMVERGRWQRPKLNYQLRLCTECNDIEDEYHILLMCPRFDNIRKQYLRREMFSRPSMYKFINFINTARENVLKRFGLMCFKILKEYDKMT